MTVPLDYLRTLATQFRPDTCTIQRATETVTSGGVTYEVVDVQSISNEVETTTICREIV
jgi:hypothetical protein